jgi:hypothetical protein
LNATVGGKEEEKNFEEGKKKSSIACWFFHITVADLERRRCRSVPEKVASLEWSLLDSSFIDGVLCEILQSPELILEQHIQEKI